MNTKIFILLIISTQPIFSEVIKPVVGILPFTVPKEISEEIGSSKKYISGSLSKWLEIYNTRWIPIDIHSTSLIEELENLNGVVIMGEKEEFDNQTLINEYNDEINKIIKAVFEINKTRYFPIIAIGFGAKLLFSVLTENKIPFIDHPELERKMLNFKFTNEGSFFKDTFSDLEVFSAVKYPSLGRKFIDSNFALKNLKFRNDFTIIANIEINSEKQAIGFYEHKNMPIFGLLSDFHTVHFTHELIIDDFDFEKVSEIGYTLSYFWSVVLKKRNNSPKQEFVLNKKKNWDYFSSSKLTSQFEEIYIKDM